MIFCHFRVFWGQKFFKRWNRVFQPILPLVMMFSKTNFFDQKWPQKMAKLWFFWGTLYFFLGWFITSFKHYVHQYFHHIVPNENIHSVKTSFLLKTGFSYESESIPPFKYLGWIKLSNMTSFFKNGKIFSFIWNDLRGNISKYRR
jgi:hypothetical protein